MKKFTLMMIAGLFALAGTVQAQEKQPLIADNIELANGATTDLVIKLDYETTETVCGVNFSLYLPDGVLLDGFESKAAQDDAKASALKKACDLGEDGVWGEDATAGWLSVKQKADGGLLFVLIDQDDQTPFVSTKANLVTVKLKAIADVKGSGKISTIGITNDKSISLDRGNLADYTFGINQSSEGINDIQSADASAPAYNLQGVRVNANAKGIIIRDGKKQIVK